MRKIMKRKSRTTENAAEESEEQENSAVAEEESVSGSVAEDDSNTSWKSKNKRKAGKSAGNADEQAEEDDSNTSWKSKNKRKAGKSAANADEQAEENSESVTEEDSSNSRKSKGKRKSSGKSDDADEVDKKKSKKGNKKGKKTELETNGAGSDVEEQYEVQAVMDQKLVKGVKQYLIRWKGYGADSDTWEPESTLSCPELIAKFIASKEKKPKGRPSKKPKQDESDDDDDGEPGAEYEVDRIIDVYFKKNGKREFLVHWKGYTSTDNTWEPEDNMQCTDLIKKFMDKVDKARESNSKELRVNRKPTKHFTLSMTQSGRRLSRRNLGKQRAHYAELD